ncbi:MAG TPA: cytochrome c peroxidase [Chryseosolibacter sp.]|nr:cytochrome c peroxidase [Chryseosolibacter sp.]
MKNPLLVASIAGLSLFIACQDSEPIVSGNHLDLPEIPYQYPSGDHLPTLGRVLFYDRQLSINNSVSCASCHKQQLAFSDNVPLSRGFESRLTLRNSMPIQNVENTLLFWDGREHMLPSMVMRPIVNHVEMGIPGLDVLSEKLSSLDYYNPLFNNAFGDERISSERVSVALASFLSSIQSRQTKFDKVMEGQSKFSALETQGLQLFIEKYDCNGCHQVQDPHGYLSAGTFSNIGLDATYADNGLGELTGRDFDAGKFKIPSLRNVAITGPYMHDGRFQTLEEVIDHYSGGVQNHPNLDFRLMKENSPVAFNISDTEKKAIVAFLNSLTDYNMITDPRFSNPFKTN